MSLILIVIVVLLLLIADRLGVFSFLDKIFLSGWLGIIAMAIAGALGGTPAAVVVGVAALLIIGIHAWTKSLIKAIKKARRERFIKSLATDEEWASYRKNSVMPNSLHSKFMMATWLAHNPGKTERDYKYMWHREYEQMFPGTPKFSEQYAPRE